MKKASTISGHSGHASDAVRGRKNASAPTLSWVSYSSMSKTVPSKRDCKKALKDAAVEAVREVLGLTPESSVRVEREAKAKPSPFERAEDHPVLKALEHPPEPTEKLLQIMGTTRVRI